VSLLVWNLTLDLSGSGDPASSFATAGIVLEIIGARKPHRHDKAETPPGGKNVKGHNKRIRIFPHNFVFSAAFSRTAK
jgi:hypothetical protein